MAKQADDQANTAVKPSAKVLPFRGPMCTTSIEFAQEMVNDPGRMERARLRPKSLARDLDELYSRVSLLACASGSYVVGRDEGVDRHWEDILRDLDGLALVARGKRGVAKKIRRQELKERKTSSR